MNRFIVALFTVLFISSALGAPGASMAEHGKSHGKAHHKASHREKTEMHKDCEKGDHKKCDKMHKDEGKMEHHDGMKEHRAHAYPHPRGDEPIGTHH